MPEACGAAVAAELQLAQLLHWIAAHDGQSQARAAKKLGWPQSQLQRLLTVLGDDPHWGGLGLVRCEVDGERRCLFLTPQGRAWLAQAAQPAGTG